MSKFTLKSNLPTDCAEIAIGEKYSGILDNSLKSLGITPLYVPDNPFVDDRLSGHADLSVFHAGGKEIFLAPYLINTEFSKKIADLGFNIHLLDIKQDKLYPFDAALNACAFGDTLIYNKDVTSQDIVKHFEKAEKYNLISTKQGYARCSVCIVDERSIITSDRGIYNAAVASNVEALLITQGYIELSGFQYGFLGGASFKIARDKLCFTGTLNSHPDKNKILDFIKSRNVEPLFLTDLPIFDIGSAAPLTEAGTTDAR